jgi:hypothetical protein
MDGEDSKQSEKQTLTPEPEETNYAEQWQTFYETDLVKYEDDEDEINRHHRYNNLPDMIKIGGKPLQTDAARQVLEKKPNDTMQKHLDKYEKLEKFLKRQMKLLNISGENGEKFLSLSKKTELTAGEYHKLLDFTDKMEQVIQAGLKEGYQASDIAT